MSTSDQSVDLQLDGLRHLAEQRRWAVVGEYVDHGISGAKDRRPELDRLMKDAHRGKLDLVACWRFDRFARAVRHLVIALDDFRARGIDFISMHDGIDTSTPAGRFSFTIIAAMAELERELIRERTKAGLQAAKRRGAKLGRPRVLTISRERRKVTRSSDHSRARGAPLHRAEQRATVLASGKVAPSRNSPCSPRCGCARLRAAQRLSCPRWARRRCSSTGDGRRDASGEGSELGMTQDFVRILRLFVIVHTGSSSTSGGLSSFDGRGDPSGRSPPPSASTRPPSIEPSWLFHNRPRKWPDRGAGISGFSRARRRIERRGGNQGL
ncbi:recombinase family protein [Sorangium sp. So ce1024]|uniref:recombinase family protein n=1 Tax=Sorangium sp. So ce1024 TaxID=3133327 RepID=UPI003F11F3A0